MQPFAFDQWAQPNRFSWGPFAEWQEITTQLCGDCARKHVQAMSELMRTNSEHWQNLCHAKGLEEVIDMQSQYMQKAAPALLEHAQGMIAMWMKGAQAYQAWFEKGMTQWCKQAASLEKAASKKS